MAMQIHVFNEIPSSAEERDKTVIDDLLNRQRGKFIISKEEVNRLFIFPFWCKHADIMRRQIEDLGVLDFHGAGVVRIVNPVAPIDPNLVGMVYDSDTMRTQYDRDKPTDKILAESLITEGAELIATVFTSIQTRRNTNEIWSPRNYDANHRKKAKMES